MTDYRPNVEFTITAKNEEKTMKKCFNVYQKVTLDPFDEVVQRCAKETLLEFKDEADHVVLKALMVLR